MQRAVRLRFPFGTLSRATRIPPRSSRSLFTETSATGAFVSSLASFLVLLPLCYARACLLRIIDEKRCVLFALDNWMFTGFSLITFLSDKSHRLVPTNAERPHVPLTAVPTMPTLINPAVSVNFSASMPFDLSPSIVSTSSLQLDINPAAHIVPLTDLPSPYSQVLTHPAYEIEASE